MDIKKISYFDDRFYKIEDDNINDVQYYPSVTTVLGVTSKPWIAKWYGDLGTREAQRRKDEAADSGSRLHHAAQSIMEGGMAIYNPKYQPAYTREEIQKLRDEYDYKLHVFENQEEWIKLYRFYQWVDVVKPIHISSEVIAYDTENQVAGSMDYLWYITPGEYKVNGTKPVTMGGLMIFDLKTGNALDDDYKIQISKYASMYNSMCDNKNIVFKDDRIPELEDMRVTSCGLIHVSATKKQGIEGVSTILLDDADIQGNTMHFNNHLLPVWRHKNPNISPKVIDMPSMLKIGE